MSRETYVLTVKARLWIEGDEMLYAKAWGEQVLRRAVAELVAAYPERIASGEVEPFGVATLDVSLHQRPNGRRS